MSRTQNAKKEVLLRLVEKLETVCSYADACYMKNTTATLTKDHSSTEVESQADAGVKIRAFNGQFFEEICIQGWQPAVLQSETTRLLHKLRESQQKQQKLKVGNEKLSKDFETTHIKDPSKISMAEKTEAITAIYNRVRAHSQSFVNCTVMYREEHETRVFVNRTKQLTSKWTGCTVLVMPYVQTVSGQTRSDYFMNFSNGFEVLDIDEDEFAKFLKRAVMVKTARKLSPGTFKAVLSPQVSGLLAHESFGHGMESDTIVRGKARAEEFIGSKLASVKVNICDDGSLPATHGFIFFDDEGMVPRRTHLMEKGTVKNPITESLSATRGNFPRTANGRAESFDRKIYARMTNTFFEQGKDSLDKMIKSVKDGLYIHSGNAGMEDPKGWGVQISGLLCERIKNGKLTGELYYEATISGYLPDILKNIKMVGNDFNITSDAGFCGKSHKEWVRVSSGGPHLLIEELELS